MEIPVIRELMIAGMESHRDVVVSDKIIAAENSTAYIPIKSDP
jgi:hypothetical protein